MKVFLSWSGKTSREVAQALHDWLPFVIQAVKPFISTGDIDKGRRWSDVLATELNDTAYGILIVTPENFDKPWINFEAGAISKAVDKAYVSPFLFNIDPTRLVGPLSQFQATVNDPEDILRLLGSINSRLPPDQQLAFEVLNREFELLWPDLKAKLDDAAKTQDLETHTGFPWLYTADDVAHRQTDATTRTVWIVTPNVYRNILNDGLKKALQANVERAVTYVFVMPASDAASAARESLKRLAGGKTAKVLINELPEDAFREAAVTDYIILNPDTDSMTTFLELPIAASGFWIKVDEEAAVSLVVRFRKLAQASATL
jgi:TIR domain-containing protein